MQRQRRRTKGREGDYWHGIFELTADPGEFTRNLKAARERLRAFGEKRKAEADRLRKFAVRVLKGQAPH